MEWTKEDERNLVILLSIIDLGGYGTKEEVLNNIESQGYLNFDERDKGYQDNGELVWRNDLAWVRYHLVVNEIIDGRTTNEWRITNMGKLFFCGGVYFQLKELTESTSRKPAKLANNWYKKVKQIIRQECPHMKNNIDRVLSPDVIKYIDCL